MLVALLLLLVFTLRTTVVSIFSSISRPLVITIMTIMVSMVFINNPGVMANNTRMMITRLLFFMTIGLGHILTLLNICNIYNYFISTASSGNLYQRVGGGCSSHNLRLAIHVAPPESPPATIFPPLPPRFQQREEESGPSLFKDQRPAVPSSQFLYYYSPTDLLRLPSKARSLNTPRRLGGPSARTARTAKNSSNSISPFSFTILLYLFILKSLLIG